MPLGELSPDRVDRAALSLLTPAQAHALRCVPFRFEGRHVAVAVDEGNILSSTVDGFTFLTLRDARPVETEPSNLTAALDRYFGEPVETAVEPALPESVTSSWAEREVALFKVFYFLVHRIVLERAGRLRVRPSGEIEVEGGVASGGEPLRRSGDVPSDLHDFLAGLVRAMSMGGSSWAMPFTLFGDRRFVATVEVGEGEVSISVGDAEPRR